MIGAAFTRHKQYALMFEWKVLEFLKIFAHILDWSAHRYRQLNETYIYSLFRENLIGAHSAIDDENAIPVFNRPHLIGARTLPTIKCMFGILSWSENAADNQMHVGTISNLSL